MAAAVDAGLFEKSYADVFRGDERWRGMDIPEGGLWRWDPDSTYVQEPPYFENFAMNPAPPGNIRLRNELVPGREGNWTEHLPSGEVMSIYDAAMKYKESGTPLIVIGGKEYGQGSSRDWAAKGPMLQGVKAVLVESFERIHRSNLVMMGIIPLQFKPGENRQTLGLTGRESYSVRGIADGLEPGKELTVE